MYCFKFFSHLENLRIVANGTQPKFSLFNLWYRASENNINNDLNETSHEDNLDANRIFFYGVFNVAKKQILKT